MGGPGRTHDWADAAGALAVLPSGVTLSLELAVTEERRALGLMHREEVPRGTGMLFLFDRPERHTIWMFNCKVPLDIAWLDASGDVVHLVESAAPCRAEPCERYSSPVVAERVIEVAGGEARRIGLVPGARVVIEPIFDRSRS